MVGANYERIRENIVVSIYFNCLIWWHFNWNTYWLLW